MTVSMAMLPDYVTMKSTMTAIILFSICMHEIKHMDSTNKGTDDPRTQHVNSFNDL